MCTQRTAELAAVRPLDGIAWKKSSLVEASARLVEWSIRLGRTGPDYTGAIHRLIEAGSTGAVRQWPAPTRWFAPRFAVDVTLPRPISVSGSTAEQPAAQLR